MIELAVAALSMFGSVGAAFFSAYPQIRGSGGFAAAASNIDARRRLRKAAYIAVAFSAMIGVLYLFSQHESIRRTTLNH